MQKPTFPKILAVDFDGTIVTHAYPSIGELRLNVVKNMKKLHDEGFYIIINTCRFGEYENAAREFLEANSVSFDIINEHNPDVVAFYKNNTRKISADCYIDDRSLGGIPDDWDTTYLLIHRHFENLKVTQ